MTVVNTLLQVFGGLAIFIFGMKLMSNGLYNVAGEKMKSVLQFFASNRYVAILSGAVVTAAIQSSGASTVMVIGFINAGLLNLTQAVGIIFGSNIGTTITAQIIAFDVGWLIMPIIIAGLILGFMKSQSLKNWGDTVIGLGFLFFGMEWMSLQLKALKDYEWFVNIFKTFNCAPVDGFMPILPLFGAIIVGFAVTVMMQSSSACSGVVLALGASGVLDIYTAIALILGSNIGSTTTAQLAAIAANRIAKQAALAHTLFNVIGVVLTIATFWIVIDGQPVFFKLIDWISAGGGLPRQIANAHTVFNVLTTVVLTPFIPLFAACCQKIIPVKDPNIKFQRLEPHLLATPSIALQQTVSTLRRMLKKAWKMTDKSLKMVDGPREDDPERIEKLKHREERVDALQKEITDYLTQLMGHKLTASQANVIPILIHCTNDTERIGDHTAVILDIVDRLRSSGRELSEAALEELHQLHAALDEQTGYCVQILEKWNPEHQARVLTLGRQMRTTCDDFEASHVQRLSRGDCHPSTAVCYIELLAEFRKISHHVSNIAERAEYIARMIG